MKCTVSLPGSAWLCAALFLPTLACSDSDDPASGGNAGTASTSNAGSGGGGGDAGGANLPPTALVGELCPDASLFCDDFEDDVVDQFPRDPWLNSTNGAGTAITVDQTRAFSGDSSVLVSMPGGSAYNRGYFGLSNTTPEVFPAAAQEMYGRAMMYLDATPDGEVHWTFIQAEGNAVEGDQEYRRMYRYGGQLQGGAGLMANYETTNISTDCWQHSSRTMPTGQWACVEWHFAVEGNEMEMWLDGEYLEDVHIQGSGEGCIGNALDGQWLAPSEFQVLYLGWERYQLANNDRNLWVDDVVVSEERVGCPVQ